LYCLLIGFEKNLEEEMADIRSGKYVGVEENISEGKRKINFL